jgi:hypothetical protein
MIQYSTLSFLKNHLKYLFLPVLIIAFSTSGNAQDVIRQRPCNSPAIQKQADSLKAIYEKDGFQLIREASVTMESDYEMPVILPLQQGTLYQMVFIGEYTSKLYEVRMYDWSEKQVVYQQKRWGDVDGNIIQFAYTPKFTEYHMFKPLQANKKIKGDLCGYVMFLKKVK